jgi:hypothetical protein
MHDVETFYANLGGGWILLAVLAIILSYIRKIAVLNHIFILLFIFILFILFKSHQSFGIHHALPINFLILILILSSFMQIYTILVSSKLRIVLISCLMLCSVLPFSYVFYNFPPRNIFFTLISYSQYLPLKHPNFQELERLATQLEKISINDKDTISVFASGSTLNDTLLSFNFGSTLAFHIRYTAHVDKRDGIPIKPLLSKYAVVTSPVLLHLAPEEQYVITVPNNKILYGQGIGNAYTKYEDEYLLDADHNIRAYIFKRLRPFTKSEIDDYLSSFPEEYKLWPNPPSNNNLEFLYISD